MFYTILFLFAYKSTHTIRSSKYAGFLPNFGFEANANYSVTFSDFNEPLCFTFVPKSDYRTVRTQITLESISCDDFNGSKYFHLFIPNSNTVYEGQIQKKGIYYPLILTYHKDIHILADNQKVTKSKSIKKTTFLISAKVTEVYKNPTSCLDYRWNGIIGGKIGIIVILFCVLILWLINWFLNFSVQIWIHYFLTAVFASNLLTQTIRFFLLKRMEETDNYRTVFIVYTIFSLFSEVFLFATLLFCAKGWCIVRDTLSVKEILISFLYSVLFLVFKVLTFQIEQGAWAIVVIICLLISAVLYLRELLKSMNNANLLIYAHLLAVANAGYDVKTTPIYQKHLMYSRFGIVFLVTLIIILIYLIVSIFVDIPYGPDELCQDSIAAFFLAALAILFRLRGGKRTNYSLIPPSRGKKRRANDGNGAYNSFDGNENIVDINGDEQFVQEDNENEFSTATDEISLADLESINMKSPALNRGGKTWSEEMPLPGIPHIVNDRKGASTLQNSLTQNRVNLLNQNSDINRQMNQSAQETTVILASPDGTDTVQANAVDPGQVRHEI